MKLRDSPVLTQGLLLEYHLNLLIWLNTFTICTFFLSVEEVKAQKTVLIEKCLIFKYAFFHFSPEIHLEAGIANPCLMC